MKYRLTPQVRQQIAASIRAGGYPHIAAEAWDVPRSIFADWLKRGSGKSAREPYRSFAGEVRAAQAQARLKAELEVFQDDPKVWLEHGPGREADDNPGWSVAVKPTAGRDEPRSALLDPEVIAFMQRLLGALVRYPDAHQHVAGLLDATDRLAA